MSNKYKNVFTIKDLENLSGIKAHTIRIWEKRYAILEPMRTDSNIRFYDTQNLHKLLNVNTLNSFGYKISSISKMTPEKMSMLIKEILAHKNMANHVLNNFKLAIMNFDQPLFSSIYNILQKERSFKSIFYEYFLPLLEDIEHLCQTRTIAPAHVHFISALIKQKIAFNTEKLQLIPSTKTDRIFVLYIPDNEIHKTELMFINYELLLNGYKTIYIGESISLSFLKVIKNYFDNVTFITYAFSQSFIENINTYIHNIKEDIVNDEDSRLYLFGKNMQLINPTLLSEKIKAFSTIEEFTSFL